MATFEEGTARHRSAGMLKRNALGLWDVVFMAVATSAPITAMGGNLPVGVGFGVGTGAPATYIWATMILSVFAVGYVAMARHVTSTGAFYGFISRGIGRVPGLGAGYMVTFSYSVFEGAIIGIFAYFARNTLANQVGIEVPWLVCALVGLVAIAVLSYFEINVAAKVLTVLLLTEIAILGVMALAVLVQGGGPDGLMPEVLDPAGAFRPNGIAVASIGLAMFIAFWSWTGFESTVMYGEESRNPKKIIPIATMIAVTGVGVFYIFVSWMTIAGNGATESIRLSTSADPLQLFFAPTETYVGHWAVVVMEWLMITGSFACAMAFHNAASRYGYALGREGLLPRILGRTHRRHHSPYVASGLQTLVAVMWLCGFAAFDKDPYLDVFVLLAVLGTFSLLIVQTITMAAVFRYFTQHHPEENIWRTKVAPVVGGLAMAAVVALMIDNLDTAAGPAASSLLFKMVPYISAALFVWGAAQALYLRRSDPLKYETIGHVVLADDAHGAVVLDEDKDAGPDLDQTTDRVRR
ncbi:APC family permease [Nocardioides sp. NPDC006303]|uniref:APC family permease n=1 Tax=Nocardioides sp. NPDC006303 TaxID=3156747 RepID=UPI00339F4FA1